MAASRSATRSLRALRATRTQKLNNTTFRRFQSSQSSSASADSGGLSSGVIGGITGGALVFGAAYGYYYFSGAKTAVNSLHATKSYFDSAAKKLSDATPDSPNEAIEWLRNTALSYSAFIPGAKGYVNSAFNDLDAIRAKHGDEVDEIVKKTYNEIKDVTKSKGASTETALKVWEIMQARLKEIGNLAGDAMEQIMDNHPELKEKVGGNLDQIKQLGQQLGPEAQKQIDETWSQISGVVSSISTKGFSADTYNQVQKIVQEKVELLKKMSEQAYQKGLEQAKPYLDKNPKIKEVLEKNADALKGGDLGALWKQVKDAASSGNTEDLEKFAKTQAENAKNKGQSLASSMGIDLDKYMKMLPGGSEVWGKVQQLQDISQKHGKEAEDLLKSTYGEIKEVLEKKLGDAQKIAEKAKDNASK